MHSFFEFPFKRSSNRAHGEQCRREIPVSRWKGAMIDRRSIFAFVFFTQKMASRKAYTREAAT